MVYALIALYMLIGFILTYLSVLVNDIIFEFLVSILENDKEWELMFPPLKGPEPLEDVDMGALKDFEDSLLLGTDTVMFGSQDVGLFSDSTTFLCMFLVTLYYIISN